MSTVLERSADQRLAALHVANEIRSARARMKRQLASCATAAEVVAAPPSFAATMKVFDLLCAIRWWGPSRAQKAMRRSGISHAKTLGGLSTRQRDALVEFLGDVS